MNHLRLTSLVLMCALLVAAPVTAAAATAQPSAPTKASAPAKPRRASAAAPADPRAANSATAASRRLEDVRIEGELEVPRVTFITVRKPHRFTDFTRATGVRSSRRMAAEAKLPAWIPAPPSPTTEAQKESR